VFGVPFTSGLTAIGAAHPELGVVGILFSTTYAACEIFILLTTGTKHVRRQLRRRKTIH
jgi:hypothetical protein